MPSKKTRKTKKNRTSLKTRLLSSRLSHFLKDEKTRVSVGVFLLIITIYISLSFLSFVFTGAADHSKLGLPWMELMGSADINVDNWAGKTGAFIAENLINRGFGISALFYSFFLLIVSLRLLNIKLVSLRRAFSWSILGLIWFSLFFGFFFIDSAEDTHLFLGGLHGYYMSLWISSAIGRFGTFAIILFTLLLFMIFSFENTLPFLRTLPSRLKLTAKGISTKDVEFNQASADLESSEDENIETDASDPEESFVHNLTVRDEETIPLDEPEKVSVSDTEVAEEDLKLTLEDSVNEETVKKVIKTEEMEDYDPKLDLSRYKYPPLQILEDHKVELQVNEQELIENKNKIVKTLESYGISIDSIKATIGPTVTLYEIVPAKGIRIAKIKNLEDDIALSLSALGIRIIAPIPGKGTIGIEVPNKNPEIVSMRSVIASKKFQESKYELPIAIGKTITNETFTFDLAKMPHLLVAGATGQGKSVGLNAIIASLLYKKHPAQLKFVMVDPKKVELSIYSQIENHFLAKLPETDEPIITDVQQVVKTLNSLTIEMDQRYDLLKKAHARNIKEYNAKFIKRRLNPDNGHKYLPYIVVIVDEFADLIMTAGKEVELPIARIAQLARAVGIHMIIATQRPSTNIITGVIKANFPARIAFKVSAMVDSRTILDSPGANQLIGRGDMLISQGSDLIRVQCAFIDTPEVEKVVDFIKDQQAYPSAFMLPEYDGEASGSGDTAADVLATKDALFDEVARLIVAHQSGSTSLIQRKFSIGYNRAGRLMDQLEAAGVVGPFEGSKARKVLIPDEYSLERHLDTMV